MNIFFIAKQIVDILYEFSILDYGMLIFAAGLFIYRFVSKKIYKSLKEFVIWPDIIVFLLMLVYVYVIIRHPENSYKPFVKTMSAFTIYFLGRVFGKEIADKSTGVALVSYIIVYANLIMRFVEYFHEKLTGQFLPRQTWNFVASGALYMYKTDLALALTITSIFIYAYAKKNWFKYFTIFIVTTAVIFSTTARMGQLIFIIELLFIIYCELRKYLAGKGKKLFHISEKLIVTVGIFVMIFITVFFVSLQFSIVHERRYEDLGLTDEQIYKYQDLFHARHVVWWNALNYYSNQDFHTRAVGIDLWSESQLNYENDRFHCLYMKMIYSVGYIGTYLFFIFLTMTFVSISRLKGFKIKYLTIAFLMMFLLIGISMEALEYTQMTWYPFAFVGAVMTGSPVFISKKPDEKSQE